MRYQTVAIGEVVYLVGLLPTGGTVTIVLYNIATGATIPLTAATCTEIGTTGLYRWASTGITTQATTYTSYTYIMTDATSGEKTYGKLVVGGYTDAVQSIKTKTDNLPSALTKNTALNNFLFVMIDSTNHISGKTGLTITSQVKKDNAAYVATDNSATEVGNGEYTIDLTANDLNADGVTLKFTATGADNRIITFPKLIP